MRCKRKTGRGDRYKTKRGRGNRYRRKRRETDTSERRKGKIGGREGDSQSILSYSEAELALNDGEYEKGKKENEKESREV
jgi:hypothetical protein